MNDRPITRFALLGVALILALLGLNKIVAGARDLTLSRADRPAVDLGLRWIEWRYVFRHGQNPFDIYLNGEPEGPVPGREALLRDAPPGGRRQDPALGMVIRAPYPPWTYVLGTPVLALPFGAARWAMALLSLSAIATLAAWSCQRGRSAGTLAAAVAIGCAHHYTVLRLGQPTGLVVASLALAHLAIWRDRQYAAGALVAIAMFKPTIAAPFALVLLVRRQWRAAATLASILVVASAIVWGVTGAAPWRMIRQMQAIAEAIEVGKSGAAGPIEWFTSAGLSPAAAARATALTIVPCFAGLLWWFRDRSTTVLFAIAALGAQLWTHHKPYDELVLLLLAAPLIGVAGDVARRWGAGEVSLTKYAAVLFITAAVVVSLTHLGVPRLLGGSGNGKWISLQVAAWVAGLVVLIREDRVGREDRPSLA